jgi:hypothetical protein
VRTPAAGLVHLGRGRNLVHANVLGRPDRDAPVIGELREGERDGGHRRGGERRPHRSHLALREPERLDRQLPRRNQEWPDEDPRCKGRPPRRLGRSHVERGRNAEHLADDQNQLREDAAAGLPEPRTALGFDPPGRLGTRLSQPHLGLLEGFMPLL